MTPDPSDKAARLKARLAQWQTYNNQGSDSNGDGTGLPPAAKAAEASVSGMPLSPEEAQHRARIAELQATVEHERVQNQQLAQTVWRAQALHLVSLHSQAQTPSPAHPIPPPLSAPPLNAPSAQPVLRSDEIPSGGSAGANRGQIIGLLVGFVLLVLIALGLIGFALHQA